MNRDSRWFRTGMTLAMTGLMAFAVGCGGGGGDGDDADVDAGTDALTGVFVDSPVAGLRYATQTLSGYTDDAGRFQYMKNERIRFYLGDADFGEAPAKPYMTPMDLVDGAEDVDDASVTNMGRFMQGLDADGDPENGIQIPPEAEEALQNRPIDFDAAVDDFGADPDVAGVFDDLNGRGAFGPGGHGGLRGVEASRQHLREHMPAGWEGDWRPGGPLPENPEDAADAFPMFIDENDNGVCDYLEEGTHDPGDGHAFIDEDGDGVCDLAQNGGNAWHGPGFVDEDGDGVCDYWDPDARRFNRNAGMQFVDADENGVCDYWETGTHDPGVGQGPGFHEFIDEDNDGVCDLAQDGSNAWHGPGYVDADNDGVCDHWGIQETEGGEFQYGRGNGHRRPTT